MSMNPIDRLKILINSSTPIVVMETVEEVRALLWCARPVPI